MIVHKRFCKSSKGRGTISYIVLFLLNGFRNTSYGAPLTLCHLELFYKQLYLFRVKYVFGPLNLVPL